MKLRYKILLSLFVLLFLLLAFWFLATELYPVVEEAVQSPSAIEQNHEILDQDIDEAFVSFVYDGDTIQVERESKKVSTLWRVTEKSSGETHSLQESFHKSPSLPALLPVVRSTPLPLLTSSTWSRALARCTSPVQMS